MREVSVKAEPTILVTGVNGQVGFELLRSLQGLGRVVACDRSMLDLSDLERVRSVVRELKPSIIVNPAAYTAVDKAETDVEGARRLNADVPRVFAEEAARSGAVLIHYSTDYVFDGTKDGAYVETDATNPQNVYGLTKLEGEQAIAATGCAHLILRTSWVYGRRGKNFLLTMLKLGSERPELKIVADQIGAPTWSKTIATATSHIVAQALAADEANWWARRSGVYHFTSAGATSWHRFAEAILVNAMGERAPKVVPIPASDYPVPAKRPANSRLSHAKLTETFGLRLPEWDDALKLCLSE
ncbi:dTDP-4-dehydrorhamnose reductase [Burkholderia pseudomultivorans]|uniref:dTDP-4-dehydrorhamnose reductase n=1 Tax=Burkholderia pseudomultivorans TaxID=1207504 RepID=A0ABU2E820_9BURK|nr:dTDP-4-dehydrorhamnose reductase [Burkholderia pseudomultivorans]MDR8737976.1 dTDP-4-dehydrorhamnose reductase [Burkholderia pseudomultivorans]MDR8744322.1 dTDP-4-dehydrorhamnose reductase [Burkholderia pseudomultivorans]MDR8756002.1 dTDP-4-dehydrorhamnose reductase [Burkholderia pseudomultivorans]MDR8780694.1 dTDP-4-dehydrorhamnose reductase [Burkholderia pseudomultivorans]MDR8870250.1 dTDP-4-dehydrorhamnose reductase [Burkholderia pseudomultivorans]